MVGYTCQFATGNMLHVDSCSVLGWFLESEVPSRKRTGSLLVSSDTDPPSYKSYISCCAPQNDRLLNINVIAKVSSALVVHSEKRRGKEKKRCKQSMKELGDAGEKGQVVGPSKKGRAMFSKVHDLQRLASRKAIKCGKLLALYKKNAEKNQKNTTDCVVKQILKRHSDARCTVYRVT